MLIDCGKASKVTCGERFALWCEVGTPPFNKNSFTQTPCNPRLKR
jgi:hypothetical protein